LKLSNTLGDLGRKRAFSFLSYRFDDDSPFLFAHIDNLVEIKLHGFHDSRRNPDRRAITPLFYCRSHDNYPQNSPLTALAVVISDPFLGMVAS
jgi:hypothetical protein